MALVLWRRQPLESKTWVYLPSFQFGSCVPPGRLLHLSELPRVYLTQSNLRGCEDPVFTSQATPSLAVRRNWLCHLLI